MLSEYVEVAEELRRRRARNRLRDYRPYPRQAAFHALGAQKRERLFMAGNQLGKTVAGAAEMAMHLTGRYPDWWQGRRFDRPIAALAGSDSAENTRRGIQRLLVGTPGDESAEGTGYIPGDDLVDTASKRGVADALETIVVKHISGGRSTLGLKSYEQGRAKWQTDTVHAVWFDEEPPPDVYTEGLTRTNATRGLVFLTFTPLLGMSDVVMRFVNPAPDDPGAVDRGVTTMTIDDAPHIDDEERARIVARYPEHEREARTMGVPSMGSGRVFPVAEQRIICDPFELPNWWPQIVGIDFGWDHPFAAARCAWDRDNDVWYVVNVYRESQTTPIMHAASIRPWGEWIPVAWPHDGLQHEKSAGEPLAEQYRKQALNLLHEKATHESGGNSVEAGVIDMLERMQTGRFKVFRGLTEWFEEFRLYHRDKGIIVKERDDLLSATRYALMMRRFASVRSVPRRSHASPSAGAWMG